MDRIITTIVITFVVATTVVGQEAAGSPIFGALRKLYDTNHDGKISAEEFPREPERFKKLDKNADGTLTPADFSNTEAFPPMGDARGRRRTDKKPAPAAPEAASPATPTAPPTDAQIKFFESKIRPVLATNCYGCHSENASKVKGGLYLDAREAMLKGGKSGDAAIVPGDAEKSLLVAAIRYSSGELRMPPKGKLEAGAIEDLEQWIAMGAPWPAEREPVAAKPAVTSAPASKETPADHRDIDFNEARKFWSFKAPVKPVPPDTANASWAWTEVDRFVHAAMKEHQLAPVKDADRGVWLRRVTFDLTGLPPTPEAVDAFEKDRSENAHEKVVDRLLAAREFGERWGRHWLDVARYAESSGKEIDVLYPQAWRYRDYVIQAFNDDKPYDQFLKEQLAGDLLPASDANDQAENTAATGFLALGAKSHNTRNPVQFSMDLVDEQIDATTQAMLGLTVACARCHDHKFDPIPQQDYYAMAGIFLSTETCYGTIRQQGNAHPSKLIPLPEGADLPNGPKMSAEQRRAQTLARDRLQERLDQDTGAAPARRPGAKPKDGEPATPETAKKPDPQAQQRIRVARDQIKIIDDLLARFDENGNALASNRSAMGAREAGRPKDARILERGEIDKAGKPVPRGFVRILLGDDAPEIAAGSGRKELAEAIASPQNPLTARVMVNRIWLHLFGKGLVATPDNFGMSGQKPTHPELLDWLAVSFVENGWSMKRLIKDLVLSHTYRLSSVHDPKGIANDPETTWLWRMPPRRLDAEAIRDAMLAAAGTLQKKPPVGSPVGSLEGANRRDILGQFLGAENPVRSVYLPILRSKVPEALEVFDFAEPAFVTGARDVTNVATQALYLMNDDNVLAQASAMASRITKAVAGEDARINLAFQLALGRKPSTTETEAVRKFLREFRPTGADAKAEKGRDARSRAAAARAARQNPPGRATSTTAESSDPETRAWAAFCQSLFACAEFRYVD